MKKKRQVKESVKNNIKAFNRLKKKILHSLKEGEKTIPAISEEMDDSIEDITFNLMTLIKFGFIEAGNLDDNDEYYYYKLKNSK